MRPFDRDLIRGGHYGQRSREPRSKAEHMAAPTNPAPVKKTLANSEPSTHGPSRPRRSTTCHRTCKGRGNMKLFSRAPLATLLMLLPALGTAAAAEKQYGPGVTDTEI